jgi:hypothetical protein
MAPYHYRTRAEACFGIAELAFLILDYLTDRTDLKNASLVCRTFHKAARVIVWRSIRLPNLRMLYSTGNPFWRQYTYELGNLIRSVSVDMRVMEPELYAENASSYGGNWTAELTDSAKDRLETDFDTVFSALEHTLSRARGLRCFKAQHIPRVPDLFDILQHCKSYSPSVNHTPTSPSGGRIRLLTAV